MLETRIGTTTEVQEKSKKRARSTLFALWTLWKSQLNGWVSGWIGGRRSEVVGVFRLLYLVCCLAANYLACQLDVDDALTNFVW